MKPRIGITTCLDDRGRWREGRDYLYLDQAYVRAVEDAGGRAVILPMQGGADELVAGVDALLLPGGNDFLPSEPYSEPVAFDPAPEAQIAFDRSVLRAARQRGLPMLGLCYGMQLLALEHGGRLHHHLPLDLPESSPHQLPEAQGRHAVRVEAGTRLAALYGEGDGPELSVNSLHHQGVAEPGVKMRVSARSPDGVIEAIEREGPSFVLGLQWHPEKLDGDDRLAPFRGLVAAGLGG
jgi:putative glutamine amidotransferase